MWSIGRFRASATVGCCSHGTIVQCGVDVFFLGNRARRLCSSQVPTSDQMGVWQPISAPIKRYIDRINWAQADQARATYWKDLYILSVPIDDSQFNNAIFAYSVTLTPGKAFGPTILIRTAWDMVSGIRPGTGPTSMPLCF